VDAADPRTQPEARALAERLGYRIERDLGQDDAWIVRELYGDVRVVAGYLTFAGVCAWLKRAATVAGRE
jgi:hypothetical protein